MYPRIVLTDIVVVAVNVTVAVDATVVLHVEIGVQLQALAGLVLVDVVRPKADTSLQMHVAGAPEPPEFVVIVVTVGALRTELEA